jgi:hypothetical protein
MFGETEHQFSPTRAVLSTCGRTKSKFLSVTLRTSLVTAPGTGLRAACLPRVLPAPGRLVAGWWPFSDRLVAVQVPFSH